MEEGRAQRRASDTSPRSVCERQSGDGCHEVRCAPSAAGRTFPDMANHHFGNVGDVLKHLLLGEVLAGEQPRCYFETHAGSIEYSLADYDPGPGGVWDFQDAAKSNAELRASAYAKTLATIVGTPAHPGRYPGSVGVALEILGPETGFVACDLDPISCRSLEAGLREAGASNAKVLATDGIDALSDAAAGDRLVLVDPFKIRERSSKGRVSSWEAFADLTARGEAGLLWYSVRHRGQRLMWPAEMVERGGASFWRVELRWNDHQIGMAGCGLIATGLRGQTIEALEALVRALAGEFASRLDGLRTALGGFEVRGAGTPWHPHGADHATTAEVASALADCGSSVAILERDGSPWLAPICAGDIAIDTDEHGLVRLVITDHGPGSRPVTIRVGFVKGPLLQTDEGDWLLLSEATGGEGL